MKSIYSKLTIIVSLLMVVTIISPAVTSPTAAQSELPETLPNGVAAGDATEKSVVLWTHSTELGDATFELASDADFAEIVSETTVEVTDVFQPVKTSFEGLTAGTQYYYRVTNSAGNSAQGTFRTPNKIGETTGLRFGVTGDWRGELSPYPAINNAIERDLDFFVLHGDTIYADYPSPDLDQPQAFTLEDYRIKHNEVYSTRYDLNAFAELRSATVIYAMIDDHEVTNDFAGGAPPSYDPRFADYEGEFVNQTELYQNGLQAFMEYNPINELFYEDTGNNLFDGRPNLYRYRTFGSDAAIFMVDARSFRDTPLDPVEDLTDNGEVVSFLNAAYDDERTMLGEPQFEQLKTDLIDAQAQGVTWKFVLVPEPIQNFGSLLAEDRYEGYAAERTELLTYLLDNEISNVIFISADFHGTVINNITYQNGLRDLLSNTNNPTPFIEVVTGSVAFDEPFGPSVVNIAYELELITEEQFDSYFEGDRAYQDEFMENLINAQVEPFGYTPVGLDDLEGVDVELTKGQYLATNFFGWTEFEIDEETQALTVRTYGIEPYNQAEMDATAEEIILREPEIVSEFVVQPQ